MTARNIQNAVVDKRQCGPLQLEDGAEL